MQVLQLLARFRPALLGACAGLALLAPVVSADVPAGGYQLASQPSPAPFSATCTLPGGDLVTFDGLNVERWSAGGAFIGTLATLPGFTFASFVVPTPDGSAVVFAESSNGDLFVAQADGSGYTPLVNLPLSYDADWLPGGDLIVSAATNVCGSGNDFWRVGLSPRSATCIGEVDGPSGPLAVAADGSLYYATQDPVFPPPLGSTDVIRWDSATVLAGNLDAANAVTVGAGFDGCSSLAIDPVSGHVYMAETNFGLGEYRIRRVGADPASSPIVVDQGADYISNLEFVFPGGPGSFAAWQPADGVNLKYNQGFDQHTVRPRRALLSIRGPGTTGPGTVIFEVSGGVPDGIMLAVACPVAFVAPSEVALPTPDFLFVTPFELAKTRRASAATPLFLDASGAGTFEIFNSGALGGLYVWQFLVGTDASVLVGTTNPASF